MIDLDGSGRKVVDYRIDVACSLGNRTVYVNRELWENDGGYRIKNDLPFIDEDDFQVATNSSFYIGNLNPGETRRFTLNYTRSLPYTDPDGFEEPYQVIQFKVSTGGVLSAPTAWEASPYTRIPY